MLQNHVQITLDKGNPQRDTVVHKPTNLPKSYIPVSNIIAEIESVLQHQEKPGLGRVRHILTKVLLSDPPKLAQRDFPRLFRFILALKPRVQTYNILLAYVAVRNTWFTTIKSIMRVMAKNGVQGDTVTLNTMLTYATRRPESGLLVPLVYYAAPGSIRTFLLNIVGEEENLFEPDVPPAVVRGLSLDNRSLQIVLRSLRRRKPSAHLESFLDNPKDLLATLPPEVLTSEVHDTILELFLRNERVSNALELFDAKKASVNTINHFLRHYAAHRNWPGALRILKTLGKNLELRPDITSYHLLLTALIKDKTTNPRHNKEAIFRQLWDDAGNASGYKYNDYTMGQLRATAIKRGWSVGKYAPSSFTNTESSGKDME